MVIWKYRLELGLTFLEVPANAKLLTMQTQNGIPNIWFLVDPDQEKEKRTFTVWGTGALLGDKETIGNYVGTFQLGGFVGHVFELNK